MEYQFSHSQEELSAEELAELQAALDDGFSSYLLAHVHHEPINGVVDEPFWGARVHADDAFRSAIEADAVDYEFEGYTREEAVEQVLDRLEMDIDDAPSWIQSNPFGWNSDALVAFFTTSCAKALGSEADLLTTNGGELDPLAFVAATRPFSRLWFDLHICRQFMLCDVYRSLLEKPDQTMSKFWAESWSRHHAILGRMIEGYRWRFAYGEHALRGKAVRRAAQMGGSVRAVNLMKSTQAILSAMTELVAAGHSISRAAHLAHRSGFGSSADANRKLWHRHVRK